VQLQPFNLHSYPKAIAHFDGDAFFASVEQAVNPALKGRPVVTGKERGIIACANYEAKARGVSRGISLRDAAKICPGLVILPSDYETYSLYSRRMFDIMRRYTPVVEEYSIDEGFADLTGLRRVFHTSYDEIARRIQADISAELDITVSVGLSLSKGLAKLASDFRKPSGFTAVEGRHIHIFLGKLSLDKVWGFGSNTVQLLEKQGLKTALDFAVRPEKWVEHLMGKVGREIWNELRGITVNPVTTEEKSVYYSISKCKTFTAPSSDPDFVWAKLVRNLESALIKARRYRLRPRVVAVALRRQDFNQDGLEAKLNRPASAVHEILPLVRGMFERLYRQGVEYRTTMVVLGKLESDGVSQYEFFEDRLRIDKIEAVSRVIDEVNGIYGKHALSFGTSLYLDRHRRTDRDDVPERKVRLLPGETRRQRLNIPRLVLSV